MARNKEEFAAYMRDYRKKNPAIFKQMSVKKFGISLEYYYELLDKQGSLCAICQKREIAIDKKSGLPFSLAVDHCHKTGKVRGLLCMKCNRGLGMFHDDEQLLKAAIKYIGA